MKYKVSKEFEGHATGLLVGWKGYPKVNVGVLTSYRVFEVPQLLNDVDLWLRIPLKMEQVVEYRSSLIDAFRKQNVRQHVFEEIAMAKKPVLTSVELARKPRIRLNFEPDLPPVGPIAKLRKVELEETPRVERKVEKVVEDYDLKAAEALWELRKVGVYKAAQLLSAGLLGLKFQRKLVPTRWAITATHDMLFRRIIKEVKQFEVIDYFAVGKAEFFGNYICVVLLPEIWGFELVEAWYPSSLWYREVGGKPIVNRDYEGYYGRKKYVEETAGAYYAARLAVAEYLWHRKIQARAIVFRRVTEAYVMPLGVWVVEKAVREALKNVAPKEEEELEKELAFCKMKLEDSVLWRRFKTQAKLLKFA